jgi:hypothetical protein
MRATVMYGARDVRIENVPDAHLIDPTDALVRVTRAGICGSDLWPYKSARRDGPADGARAHRRRRGRRKGSQHGEEGRPCCLALPVVGRHLRRLPARAATSCLVRLRRGAMSIEGRGGVGYERREVSFEPHLTFEVREHALEREPDGGGSRRSRASLPPLRSFAGVRSSTPAAASRSRWARPRGPGRRSRARSECRSRGWRAAPILSPRRVRACIRAAARAGREQDEPHAPEEAVLRLLVAVAGEVPRIRFGRRSRGSWHRAAGSRWSTSIRSRRS